MESIFNTLISAPESIKNEVDSEVQTSSENLTNWLKYIGLENWTVLIEISGATARSEIGFKFDKPILRTSWNLLLNAKRKSLFSDEMTFNLFVDTISVGWLGQLYPLYFGRAVVHFPNY